MNAAELHLALNHVPIIGTIFGFLLLAYGRARGSDPVVRAAFWALTVTGLAAVGVYFTGEPAEHLVEELARTSESALEAHEGMALWAAIGGGALGLISLFGLYRYKREPIATGYSALTLVAALIVSGILGWTAYLGGQIRHPELRPDFTVPAEEEAAAAEESAAPPQDSTALTASSRAPGSTSSSS